jgi:hypothetical protein
MRCSQFLRSRQLRILCFASIWLLSTQHSALSTFPVFAQTNTATLSGTVVDQHGAIVPGAAVTVLNPATSLERRATAAADGHFVVPLLSPGTYTVKAEHQGFAVCEIRNVILNVGDDKLLQIQLKAGAISETVQVTGEAGLINESPATGTLVDRQFVENMPLNGRSLQSLIALTPGVVFLKVDTNPIAQGQFSVNGQRPDANYFTVDGVSANYHISTGSGSFAGESAAGSLPGLTALGGTNSLVSIDALQEFKIQTSTYAPEFGRMPGGQISLISRSGTNGFHGDVFDYLRNDVLDANTWFANRSSLAKAKERQNDFGGVFGGPIVKNKVFFFFSYEGLRLRQPVTQTVVVPTAAARAQAAPSVRPFFDAYPLPNGPVVGTGFADFAASYSNPATLNAYSIRSDYALRQNVNIFGNYKHSPSDTLNRSGGLSVLTAQKFSNDSLTVGATWTASSSMTNDLRFNWARTESATTDTLDSIGGAVVPANSVLGTVPLNTKTSLFFWSLFNGMSTAGFELAGTGNDNIERQINVVDTFSWVKGAHQMKFGFDYRRISPILDRAGGNFQGAYFNVAPNASTLLTQIAVGGTENIVLFQNISAFGQDTWRATPRLTVVYGLRWDINPSPHSLNGHNPAVLTGVESSGAATLLPAGTPVYKTQYANFSPRVGLSYQLSTKSGRETVVRGGVGVFYDTGSGLLGTAFDHIFPYFASKVVYGATWPLSPAQAAPPKLGIDPPQQLWAAVPNLKLPYTVQYNFSVEQALGRSQSVTLSYIGSVGRRLLFIDTAAVPVTGFPGLIPYYLTTNASYSNYNALQVQYQRRLSRGIQALVSYTFSKSLDTTSGDDAVGIPPAYANVKSLYGPSDFDARHSISGAVTFDLPSVERGRFLHAVTKGWGLDALVRYRTALPTDVVTFNLIGAIGIYGRPNVVPGVPLVLTGSQYPGGKQINPAALVQPPNGTVGNLSRNAFRFFNASQADVGMRRQFTLTERLKLQFKMEFFNIFNHPNFADPNGQQYNANWFVSTQTLAAGLGGLNPLYQIGGPRSGQASLKFIF